MMLIEMLTQAVGSLVKHSIHFGLIRALTLLEMKSEESFFGKGEHDAWSSTDLAARLCLSFQLKSNNTEQAEERSFI
jgi:hypothetical protein